MKFTLSWLKDHLETEAPLEAIVAALTQTGLEVERVEDPAAGARRLSRRADPFGGAAPERRPAARLRRRHGRRRAGAGRLRRPERPGRAQDGVRAARRRDPGKENHPEQGRDPWRRVERHAVLGSRTRDLGGGRRDSRTARGCAGRRDLRRLCRARRPGHRDQPDPQSAGCDGGRRHRPRSRGGRPRPASEPTGRAGSGHLPVSRRRLPRSRGGGRGPRAGLRAAPRARRAQWPVAGLAPGAAEGDRAAPRQCARRRHELPVVRPGAPSARLRCGKGERRAPRAPRARRRTPARARRPHLRARPRGRRHRRRPRGRIARRHHGGRGLGLRPRDDGRPHRIRPLGPDEHRPERAAARHQQRRALPLRAGGRPGRLPARARSRDGDGARSLRRDAVGRRARRDGARAGPSHRLPVERGPSAHRSRPADVGHGGHPRTARLRTRACRGQRRRSRRQGAVVPAGRARKGRSRRGDRADRRPRSSSAAAASARDRRRGAGRAHAIAGGARGSHAARWRRPVSSRP